MPDFIVKMKDETVREFKERGRAGGSYTNSLRYEPGFAVFKDEWGAETSIPTDLIAEIHKQPQRGGW
jgi:hypothetical protein